MKAIRFTFAIVLILLASCGGGDDIDYTKFGSEDDALLQGRWPQVEYGIRSQSEWDQAWRERLDSLDCSLAELAAVCARTSPPHVDFTNTTVVGVITGGRTALTGSLKVSSEADGIVVKYSWVAVSGLFNFAPDLATFIIVPRSATFVRFEATGV